MAGTGCCGAMKAKLSEVEDSIEWTGDVERDGGRMWIGVRMLWASCSSLATTMTTPFLGAVARLDDRSRACVEGIEVFVRSRCKGIRRGRAEAKVE